jgi:hypothetical protein
MFFAQDSFAAFESTVFSVYGQFKSSARLTGGFHLKPGHSDTIRTPAIGKSNPGDRKVRK